MQGEGRALERSGPRQKNVQQQNAQLEEHLLLSARYWRTHPWPEALRQVVAARGVDSERSFILHMEIEFPGMPELAGTLLSQDGRFIYFEIETDPIVSVPEWKDVSAANYWNCNRHNRGVGAGRGFLALKVLHALNA